MTKKIISISAILVLALFVGLVGTAKAAGNDIVFSAATTIGIQDLVVSANSQVEGIVIDTATVTVTMASGSTITFTSDEGREMTLTPAAAAAAFTVSYTAGGASTVTITWNAAYPEVVLTVASTVYTNLTEVNVYANPLTADTASAYTVTFKTATQLVATDKIQLDFGTGFTGQITDGIADTGVGTIVLTDDGASVTPSAFLTNQSARTIIITLPGTVAVNSVINIVLNSSLVKNPATVTADTAASGIDIYTTDSTGNTKKDVALNQTAFNRVIDLVNGWNIFAPSQLLEDSDIATVITENAGFTSGVGNDYDVLWTLTLHTTTNTMQWATPSDNDIVPLYGYAFHNISGGTLKLPLDFAKEEYNNATFSRLLSDQGWHLIGYTGTSASLNAQTNCLGGLIIGSTEYFSSIVDLTGTTSASAATSHLISSSITTELASGSGMLFTKDYAYLVFTIADDLNLEGNRDR